MASEPPKVFISYNRADRDWAEWIAGAIDRSGYQPIIQAWDFRPGQNFVLRMQEAMADSDLTIAVLSEDYLKAEFTQSEWAAAFARDPTGKNRKLIPVRVAKCHLPPILSEIIYIDLVGQAEQDAERTLLDGLKPSGKPAQPPPYPGKRAESATSTAPFPPNVARLHGVPGLPPYYLPREADLAALKQKLLAGGANVGITGQSSAVGVQGMGGIGKSVLAAALARDSEVRRAFPDGIYWLTIGQKPNLLDLQNRLLRQLTGSKEALTTEQEAKDALREALEGRAALLVVDDAWTIDDADAFFVTAPPVRLLITTRNNEVLVGLGAEEHRVDVLSSSDALKMLAEWTGKENPDRLPSEAAEVAKECGYLPLALAAIGAMIRSGPTATAWKDALTRLKSADLEKIKQTFPSYPYPNLFRAVEVSIDALESVDQERYLDLAVFPEDQPIPESTLSVLWKLYDIDTRDCMTHFVVRSLGRWATDGTSLILHDLQRDLIRKRHEENLPGLHLRLVEAWDALPKLPDDYAWRWVGYHAVGAGRKEDLRRLLLDVDYLQGKLAATDLNALIADYDRVQEDKALQQVQSAIRLSAHVLARDQRQLAGQLIGRLLGNEASNIQVLLRDVAERKTWPWLQPLRASLTTAGGPLRRILEGHTNSVRAVAITPDGCRAVSDSEDSTLRVWDLESGQTLRVLEGHTHWVTAVAVTPDGCRAVSASRDRTLRVWHLDSDQAICTLKGHDDSVLAVAVTPDGRRAVSASRDRTLRVWDLETGQELHKLEGHKDRVQGVAVTEDGRAISASRDLTLRVWDLKSAQTLCILEGHYDSVLAVAVTGDGYRAVSGSRDWELLVWGLAASRPVRALRGHAGAVECVAMTKDGRFAISGSRDRSLRVWDLANGQPARTLGWHPDSVQGVAVTSDGGRVVSASSDRTLRVWDLKRAQTELEPEDHAKSVLAVGVTPDGNRALSASHDWTLRLWDLKSCRTKRIFESRVYGVRAVAMMPDNQRAILASLFGNLQMWDLNSGQMLRIFEGQVKELLAVAVIPDGRRAVSGSTDLTLQVWDLEGGNIVRISKGHLDSVNGVAVTPDGLLSISASRDRTLRVWDLESGETVQILKGHLDSVNAVAITSDGRCAVSGSSDLTIRVWDMDSGQLVHTLSGHTQAVNSVAVTADRHQIISVSDDKTVRTWNLETGKALATFTGEGRMLSCAFAPKAKERTIVAGDDSGRVHFLQLVEADKTKPLPLEIKITLLHSEPPKTEATNLQMRIQQPMPTDSNARVFVSYTSKDKPFVRKLVEALKGRNLNVWLDERELQVGDSIVAGVSQGLKNADYLVAVLSKASIGSRWVQAELNATLMEELSGKGVTVLPVLIEDCELPTLLKDRVYADFRHDFNSGLQKLLAVFQQEGESAANAAPQVATKAAPSQQLSSITLADLRRRITKRMDRGEVSALWFAVLETTMENDMAGRQLSECVISLLDKAKSRNKLSLIIEEICQDRPDLANP